MRVFPTPIEIADDEGFKPEKDIFGRVAFGHGLANLLKAAEDPLTVVIDGPWGCGKTTFMKMLAGLLRQNGHPVIYFDAFVNDFFDDAFLAVAGEIVSLSQKLKKESTSAHKNFLDKAVSAGKIIARSSIKIGVKAATLGAISSVDLDELSSVASDVAGETSSKIDEYVKTLLSNREQEKRSIEELRETLANLAAALTTNSLTERDEQTKAPQLIFIIDELDRCRPNFALDILEKIKHVFAVPGIHFILVTHLGQLESSVKFQYGSSVDARSYLQKFYSLIFHLSNDGEHEHEKITTKFFQHLKKNLKSDDDALKFIAAVADAKNLTLRPIEKIAVYMSLAIAFTSGTERRFFRAPPILGGLCTLKVIEPRLFEKAKAGALTFSEAAEAFGFSQWPKKSSLEWSKKFWRYALDPNLNPQTDEWRDFGNIGGYFHFDDRKSMVSFVANSVIDRLQIPGE